MANGSDVTDCAHRRPNRTAHGIDHLARMLQSVDFGGFKLTARELISLQTEVRG